MNISELISKLVEMEALYPEIDVKFVENDMSAEISDVSSAFITNDDVLFGWTKEELINQGFEKESINLAEHCIVLS